jgi:Uma2 family endonuclease
MTTVLELPPEETETVELTRWIWPRPITFAEFLELIGLPKQVELIDGIVVEKMAVQLDHEKLLVWLMTILNQYIEDRNLGILLGSRTAVEITQYRGRLPDLLFVKRERMQIVQQKAVYGPPDLTIEIISPGDRKSDQVALEADYRSLGVAEIVFINQRKRQVRVLRKRDNDYEDITLTTGTLELESIAGMRLEVNWLVSEPRPTARETLDGLSSH